MKLRTLDFLVIEDNVLSRQLVVNLLEDLGHKIVGQASNGQEGIELTKRLRPDVVLTDLQMPDPETRVEDIRAGIKVAQAIQKQCPTPVVALTAHDYSALIQEASAAGIGAYILKPFHAREIERAAMIAIARFEDMQSLRQLNMELENEISERAQTEEALKTSNYRLREALKKLKDTQSQMVRQERLAAVGQLSAGIAHDFRNLLTTIILYAQMTLNNSAFPQQLEEDLETVISEAKKASELVQQILDFTSQSMMEVQTLDLQDLIHEVMDILRRTIPESIQISLKVDPKDQTSAFLMRGDAGRIQQMLTNMATNARDAQPDGGELRFSLSHITVTRDSDPPVENMATGTWIYLAISDKGVGMTEEVKKHIFEPFFTTKEIDKGTGLGLAQAHGIISLHAGYVDVETELGKGTTFHVYLPASNELEEDIDDKQTSIMPQGRGEVILMVEDNLTLREVGRDILEALNYQVLVAENGNEALAIYQEASKIDLVITDIIMPKMGGKELAYELKKIDPTQKLLGITGHSTVKNIEKLRDAGFQAVIHKPFTLDILAKKVHQTLNEKVGRWG